MKYEEQLDNLIEMQRQGKELSAADDIEINARLEVAKMLTRYRERKAPQDMARRIEAKLRAHIQQQTPGVGPVHPRFSALPAQRAHSRRRFLRPLLGAAVLLLLLGAGTLTATAHALPGDPLYGMKQTGNQFLLLFAGSQSDRASDTISQLHNALSDLVAVVENGRSPVTVQQALTIVVSQTQAAQVAVAAVTGPAHASVQQEFAGALHVENQTLRALLNKVDWSTRLALTRQLGVIGQSVPTIKRVAVSQQGEDTLFITVVGEHFAAQTRLVIDGQPIGTVSQQTATQLEETISEDDWREDTSMIGVLNPDGTAVQMQVVFHEHEDSQNNDGGDHGKQDNPGSGKGTPTSGDDHGGGSGKGGSGGKGSDG